MDMCLIEHNELRAAVIRRHVEELGHSIVELPSVHGARGDVSGRDPEVIVADLTRDARGPADCLSSLHRLFPRAVSIVLLRDDQTVTAQEALEAGVRAVLREPLRLEDLDIHLALCAGWERRQ
jgi:DNA-binding NarL/FixJ family response regulator